MRLIFTITIVFLILSCAETPRIDYSLSAIDADAFMNDQIGENIPSFKLKQKYSETFRSRSKSSGITSSYCKNSREEYHYTTLTIIEQSEGNVKMNYRSDFCGKIYSVNYIGKFNDQYLLLRSYDRKINSVKAYKISDNGNQIDKYLVFQKSGRGTGMTSRTDVNVVGKNWTILENTGFVGEVSASSVLADEYSIWLRTDKPGTVISFDNKQATMCSWQDCNGARKTCGIKIDGDYDTNNTVTFHIPTNSGVTRPIAFSLFPSSENTMNILLSGENAGTYKKINKTTANIDRHCLKFF
jgi:hypothetical protein